MTSCSSINKLGLILQLFKVKLIILFVWLATHFTFPLFTIVVTVMFNLPFSIFNPLVTILLLVLDALWLIFISYFSVFLLH